jgi:3-deoxy-manno-octulosonate cytidylyltransferase (CMP-KDO synthetase)
MKAGPDPTVAIVIPARLASTRLPRKMLLSETGRTLVEHTYRAASRAKNVSRVIVATDSDEIARVVRDFGGEAIPTSPEAASGTERIVEILPHLAGIDVVVNVQGDEPDITPEAIGRAISLLARCRSAGMATLATPLRRREDLLDPSCVKAVLTPWPEPAITSGEPEAWRAITFSRSVVPFPRAPSTLGPDAVRAWEDSLLAATPPVYWQHVGLYAYRRSLLERWHALGTSRLAEIESLEQLRVIEAGIAVVAGVVESHARGIDTPADYAAFVGRVALSQ